MSETLPKYCVKELASQLKVSLQYVYFMRAAGFEMTWDARLRCQSATVEEARKWIEVTGFRIVKGHWRVKPR